MTPANRKVLTRDDITRLLQKLDADLAAHGQRAVLYVVGGANIALAIDGTRSTTDIDVVVKSGTDVVFSAAKRVAATEPGLGDDWLNSQFAGDGDHGGIAWQWFDNKHLDEPQVAYEGQGLRVELASPEMMLALKTLARRPQDLPDIYRLMRLTGITTALQLGRNLARFTGRRLFDAQNTAGMFHHIDPEFREILDQAPADL